ncbi:MAG: M48 family metallopeptidase [Myxococcota bacterium]
MDERTKRSRRLAFIGTLLAILLLVGFVSFPLLSGFVAPLLPERIENAVGAEMIKGTAEEGNFCNDPEGVAVLEDLVKRLAKEADDRTFKVYVSDQEIVNAFAAPGGHVVIFKPIIDQAEGPDEVAGVLAHEMGHVVERHPAEGLIEAVGYGIFGMLTPGDGSHEEVAKSLLTNHYSRGDELDADRAGVELLNAAGIDSRGLFSFFERLKDSGDDVPGAVEFLSTHPSGETRKANLEEVAHAGEPALSDDEWAALQAVCNEVGPPEPIVVAAQ